MPSVGDAMAQREISEKFGDKKLVVVTGTSSGLGRKTARALLRTGKCAHTRPAIAHSWLTRAPPASAVALHVAAVDDVLLPGSPTGTMWSEQSVIWTRWKPWLRLRTLT